MTECLPPGRKRLSHSIPGLRQPVPLLLVRSPHCKLSATVATSCSQLPLFLQVVITCRLLETTQYRDVVRKAQQQLEAEVLHKVDAEGLPLQVMSRAASMYYCHSIQVMPSSKWVAMCRMMACTSRLPHSCTLAPAWHSCTSLSAVHHRP